ncbi:hypothetical protein [Corynebacterium lubricantis]|uniref:hypothetical protein n=1 Tax=Corynebacterium lubricantis TaxID=541095 RepID=UPI0003704C43|nr:hypothetical protein [Corynebacterium lubricantis]
MFPQDLVTRMTDVRALTEPTLTEKDVREELESNVEEYIPFMEREGHDNPKRAAIGLVVEQAERDIYWLQQRYDALGESY